MPESTAQLDAWPALGTDADPKRVRLYTIDTGPAQQSPPPAFESIEAAERTAALMPNARVVGFFQWYYTRGMLPLAVFETDHVQRFDMLNKPATPTDYKAAEDADPVKRLARILSKRKYRNTKKARAAKLRENYQRTKADPEKYARLLAQKAAAKRRYLAKMTPAERAEHWKRCERSRRKPRADKKPRSKRP